MPHLHNRRKGWQSEILAMFLLYDFAFVFQPAGVADDIGIDFICTFFSKDRIDKYLALIPKFSVAIQVKSNKKRYSLQKWLPHLAGLDIPFFVGLADRREKTITLYSGEYLTHFLALKGHTDDLTNKVHDVMVDYCERGSFDPMNGWLEDAKEGKYFLRFPRVGEITDKMDKGAVGLLVDELKDIAGMMRKNIASTKNDRFALKVYKSLTPNVYTGRGSAVAFERNFQEGLAEVFWNLGHLYETWLDNQPRIRQIFPHYEIIYQEFKAAYEGWGYPQLDLAYKHAKEVVERD
jgi:hypothetical protein